MTSVSYETDDGINPFYAGMIVAGVGYLAGFLGYHFFNPHPIEAPEARRLADEFNKALRAELGLSEEEVARPTIPSEPEV